MHHVFDSDDIVYSILEHLNWPRRNLRNVAMTCKRLAGPALNVLWSEQSTLFPLIMCLPRDTLSVADETIVSEVYHLNLDSTMLTMLSLAESFQRADSQ
jgi:hypothetical protein